MERHGINQTTLELLTTRLTDAQGQHGYAQDCFRQLPDAFIEKPDLMNYFLETLQAKILQNGMMIDSILTEFLESCIPNKEKLTKWMQKLLVDAKKQGIEIEDCVEKENQLAQ